MSINSLYQPTSSTYIPSTLDQYSSKLHSQLPSDTQKLLLTSNRIELLINDIINKRYELIYIDNKRQSCIQAIRELRNIHNNNKRDINNNDSTYNKHNNLQHKYIYTMNNNNMFINIQYNNLYDIINNNKKIYDNTYNTCMNDTKKLLNELMQYTNNININNNIIKDVIKINNDILIHNRIDNSTSSSNNNIDYDIDIHTHIRNNKSFDIKLHDIQYSIDR